MPSTDTARFGLGRRYAVISCARDSSTPICPARKDGFACSHLSRTSCQVNAFCAKPLLAETAARKSPNHRRLDNRFIETSQCFSTLNRPALCEVSAPHAQRNSSVVTVRCRSTVTVPEGHTIV